MATPLVVGGQTIYTSPQSPAHLRSTLAAIKAYIADLYDAAGEVQQATLGATLVAGDVVYISASNTIALADADAVGTANVIGMVVEGGASGAKGIFRTGGLIELTDWTAIIGAASLTAGSRYYLSATAGDMTTTAPSTGGQFVVPLGTAITTKIFGLNIQRRIKL